MSDMQASRRQFLKASLAAPLALTPAAMACAQDAPAPTATPETEAARPSDPAPMPMRKLGKTGREVTILNLGGMMGAHSPQYLDIAWKMGFRYFDTADCYKGGQSERDIGAWIEKYPERRKDLFLVSKDHPRGGPKQIAEQVERRLKACKTDYLDLFFIHGIGPREYGKESLEWPKGGELKEAAEQLKKAGKIKYLGFSCHDGAAAQYLAAAAEGGFIDAIMVAYNPFMNPGSEMQKALDACANAGIGLIAMKTMRALGKAPKRIPEFDKLDLTVGQAVLQAVWSDERIASICSSIENVGQMKENVEAANKYKEPLTLAQIETLREVAMASQPTMCPNCDGSCARAAGRSDLALNDIARYVTYYERDGDLSGRELYHALAASLKTHTAEELRAASKGCRCNLDFASIIEKAERYFA